MAPVPGGYPAVPTAAHLLRHWTRLALLSLRGSAVAPSFPQFRRTIAGARSNADAQDFYERYVVAGKPRAVLLHAMRHSTPQGADSHNAAHLLLVVGGKDELIREMSIALLHRDHRRRQPDAITDTRSSLAWTTPWA